MTEKDGIDEELMIEILKDKVFFLENTVEDKDKLIGNICRKYGRMFEQFAPFTKRFSKEDRENFKFLGRPIDGVIFGQNEITFVEIKTGNSELTESQKRVRDLIQQKKINFWEVRFS